MKYRITECPRDAMQGIGDWIPTAEKVNYLNQLMQVGFDVIDFGSFVSPKAIPQLRDTAEVLSDLNWPEQRPEMLAIIANVRGANDACSHEAVDTLGYPFSISETFQQRNTNASIDQSMKRVEEIQEIARKNGKHVRIYISMAFGNPYGDPWSPDLAAHWVSRLHDELEIKEFALADTVGVSDVKNISSLFKTLIPAFEGATIGAHLHATPETAKEKVRAAAEAGCTSFDAAINGIGGCPMAEDELVGNVSTQDVLQALPDSGWPHIDQDAFDRSILNANELFGKYH